MLLHGTFSTAGGAFSALVASPHYASLLQHYGGRSSPSTTPRCTTPLPTTWSACLPGFPPYPWSWTCSPTAGAGWLGASWPSGDPSGMSTGAAACAPRALRRGAAPGNGDHWIAFVDRYTNLLIALLDNTATITLEGVLVAVKLLAHGALKGLPGLQSFSPRGQYLARLNRGAPHGSEYYAIAADFTPDDPGLLARFYHKVGTSCSICSSRSRTTW